MDNPASEELVDIAYDLLEPHAAFIHEGGDDEVRYFVPPEVLEALSWRGLSIVLPIFTGVTTGILTSVISERIKKSDSSKEMVAMKMQREELEKLKNEVQEGLQALKKRKGNPNARELSEAQRSLADVLKANGWPSDLAEQDAEQILLKFSAKFGQKGGRKHAK